MISSPTAFTKKPPAATAGVFGGGTGTGGWGPKPASANQSAANQSQLTMGGWGGGTPSGSPQLGAPAQGGMNYSTYGTFQQPQYISDQNTQSVMNNQLAQGDAASDLRGILKGFVQPGRSIGHGEKYRAGVESANTQQNSRFDAGQTAMNDAAQNSKMKTDFEYARDMEGQGLGALQNMLTQGNWANQFSMQQNAARQLSQRQQAALQVLGPLYAMYQ